MAGGGAPLPDGTHWVWAQGRGLEPRPGASALGMEASQNLGGGVACSLRGRAGGCGGARRAEVAGSHFLQLCRGCRRREPLKSGQAAAGIPASSQLSPGPTGGMGSPAALSQEWTCISHDSPPPSPLGCSLYLTYHRLLPGPAQRAPSMSVLGNRDTQHKQHTGKRPEGEGRDPSSLHFFLSSAPLPLRPPCSTLGNPEMTEDQVFLESLELVPNTPRGGPGGARP